MEHNELNKKNNTRIARIILLGLLGLFLILEPRTVFALPSIIPNLGVSGATGSEVPVFNRAIDEIKKKEVGAVNLPGIGSLALPTGSSWDSLAWNIANMAIHKITQDIVNWIRTGGRNGKPLFITNWEDFLKDVGNEASRFFIEELNFTEICQPFKPRLQLTLSLSGGSYYRRAQCTILDVARNVESFYRDFKQGGWQRWFEITMVPQNNFYGSYYLALEEQLSRQLSALEAKQLEVTASGGFLGEETCVETAKRESEGGTYPDDFVGPLPCVKYDVITPGKTIERQLNDVLRPPSGEDRLQVADEIDEVIAAALTKLLGTIRGKTNSNGQKNGIFQPQIPPGQDPLKIFGDETQDELSKQKEEVLGALGLSQAIDLSGRTMTLKQNSISKVNELIDTFKKINTCKARSADERIEISQNNIIQLQTDIQNISNLSIQLIQGEQNIKNSTNTDELSQLLDELKSSADTAISFYDSALAENGQVAAELESIKKELQICQTPGLSAPSSTSTSTPPGSSSSGEFNFSATVFGNQSIKKGQSATNQITVFSDSGTPRPVNFGASGLPVGASAEFFPSSCLPGCISTMNINSGTAEAGEYLISINITDGVTETSPVFRLYITN